MSARILASCSPGEVRIAVVEASALLDYGLYRPGSPDGVGDLHLGRITAHLPALGGAFVAIGAATGFLPDSDRARPSGVPPTSSPPISEGALIGVRTTRSAQGGKGPRLTARLTAGEQALLACRGTTQGLVARGPEPLVELAARWPDAPIACDDEALAARLHGTFGDRMRIVPRAFDESLQAAVESLADPTVALPGGMQASIHPTPALIAIDMDGGTTSAERRPKPAVQFAANRAAIPALLHQLRLRNLSGAILLDLAGVAARKRAALAPCIEAALARDPLRPRLLGFTALGLAEILRPRLRPPLHELLHSPAGAACAALRAACDAHGPAATPRAIRIRAGIAVIAALEADPEARAAFARRTAIPISLHMDPALPALTWMIEHG